MKKTIIAASIALGAAVGVGAGVGSFYGLMGQTSSDDKVFGPWVTLANIGEEKQNPYTRAWVALYGIWGLPPREVIYFSAVKDSGGKAINPRCTYLVSGLKPPARWWSLTAYRDGFYIDNPANRYSWSMTTITVEPDGSWQIQLSPEGRGKNGLALGKKSGEILLSYRLYQPSAGVAADPATVPLPKIARQGC